jgi:hypothetical protein
MHNAFQKPMLRKRWNDAALIERLAHEVSGVILS